MNLEDIVFFDLETTGVDVNNDKIVEISLIKGDESLGFRINPARPIPLEASEVHGIYDADVKDKPKFEDVAEEIADFIGDSSLGGYNNRSFDVPFLLNELSRAGVELEMENRRVVDVFLLYKHLHPSTLTAAYKQYTGKNLEDAHNAEADTIATREIMELMIEKNGVNEDVVSEVMGYNNVIDIAGKFVYNDDKIPVFTFGKHKGQDVRDNKSYLNWMLNSGNFPKDTLIWCTKFIKS